jgi:hypothetical protein
MEHLRAYKDPWDGYLSPTYPRGSSQILRVIGSRLQEWIMLFDYSMLLSAALFRIWIIGCIAAASNGCSPQALS